MYSLLTTNLTVLCQIIKMPTGWNNMIHLFFLYFATTCVQCQDYSKIPKWADFGFYGSLGFKELDHKLSFIMDNYEIISIEKCTGQGDGKTVS